LAIERIDQDLESEAFCTKEDRWEKGPLLFYYLVLEEGRRE